MHDEPRHAMTMDESGLYRPYQPYQPHPSDQPTSRLVVAPSQSTRDKALLNSPFALGLARVLPLIGALLLVVATWLPWETLRVILVSPGPETPVFSTDLSLTGVNGLQIMLAQSDFSAAQPSARWLGLLWTFLPLIGLLIGLFYLRMRQGSRALTALFGVWLALATLSIAPVVYGVMTTLAPLSCWQTCSPVPVTSRHPELGAWLAIGGLVLAWIAFAGLWLTRRLPLATILAAAPARFSRLHLMGAGVLMFGAALWALGLFAIPWATSGCAGLHFSLNHFVRGTCSGMDGYDMLSATLSGDGQLAWEFFEVASVVGLFIAVTVWLPRLTRATWIIAFGWSLLVALIALMGLHGIQVTMTHPPHFTINEGPWETSYGIVICALGIVVSVIGTVLLARDELRRAG